VDALHAARVCVQSGMAGFEDDPFMLVRSMMLTEFRCPPLPMRGQLAEDGSETVINSHDLLATLVAQAFRLSDETKNSTRRQMQEALRERYLLELADNRGCFEAAYAAMARHTQEYMATYLLGTPFTVRDLHVLPPDQITPRVAKEIDHYGRALGILTDHVGPPPQAASAVDYGSYDVVQALLMRCVRCAIEHKEEGVVHEPVLKRMRNGVDAE
jgi:hypothetical protein